MTQVDIDKVVLKEVARQKNERLLKELALYKETDTLTPKLKRMLMELIWEESKKSRYKCIGENLIILCEADAYVAACKHSIHFNPERSDKPNLYIGQIIWCSYCSTIKKHCGEFGLKTTRERV